MAVQLDKKTTKSIVDQIKTIQAGIDKLKSNQSSTPSSEPNRTVRSSGGSNAGESWGPNQSGGSNAGESWGPNQSGGSNAGETWGPNQSGVERTIAGQFNTQSASPMFNAMAQTSPNQPGNFYSPTLYGQSGYPGAEGWQLGDDGVLNEKTSLQKLLEDTKIEQPDLEKIRRERLKQARTITQAIQSQYANTLRDEQGKWDKTEKRQRALNVSGGLQGSDFATTGAMDVEQRGRAAIRGIESERDAKINTVLAQAEADALNFYEQQKEAYRTGALDEFNLRENFKTKALQDISNFAASGLSSTDLQQKAPQVYQEILEATGYTPEVLTAVMAAERTAKGEEVFKQTVGNNVVIGYRDPGTGTITTETVPLAEGYSDFKVIDGKPYFVDLEGGKIVSAPGYVPKSSSSGSGGSSGNNAKYTSGNLVTTKGALGQIEKVLDDSRGEDNWVDPSVYQAAHSDWVASGGITKDFLTQFPPKNYANPANDWLPQYLRNTTKTTTTTSSSSSRAR